MKNFIFPQIFQPVLIKNGCNLSFSQKYMTSRSRQPETDLPNQLNNKQFHKGKITQVHRNRYKKNKTQYNQTSENKSKNNTLHNLDENYQNMRKEEQYQNIRLNKTTHYKANNQKMMNEHDHSKKRKDSIVNIQIKQTTSQICIQKNQNNQNKDTEENKNFKKLLINKTETSNVSDQSILSKQNMKQNIKNKKINKQQSQNQQISIQNQQINQYMDNRPEYDGKQNEIQIKQYKYFKRSKRKQGKQNINYMQETQSYTGLKNTRRKNDNQLNNPHKKQDNFKAKLENMTSDIKISSKKYLNKSCKFIVNSQQQIREDYIRHTADQEKQNSTQQLEEENNQKKKQNIGNKNQKEETKKQKTKNKKVHFGRVSIQQKTQQFMEKLTNLNIPVYKKNIQTKIKKIPKRVKEIDTVQDEFNDKICKINIGSNSQIKRSKKLKNQQQNIYDELNYLRMRLIFKNKQPKNGDTQKFQNKVQSLLYSVDRTQLPSDKYRIQRTKYENQMIDFGLKLTRDCQLKQAQIRRKILSPA